MYTLYMYPDITLPMQRDIVDGVLLPLGLIFYLIHQKTMSKAFVILNPIACTSIVRPSSDDILITFKYSVPWVLRFLPEVSIPILVPIFQTSMMVQIGCINCKIVYLSRATTMMPLSSSGKGRPDHSRIRPPVLLCTKPYLRHSVRFKQLHIYH